MKRKDYVKFRAVTDDKQEKLRDKEVMKNYSIAQAVIEKRKTCQSLSIELKEIEKNTT